MSKKSLSINPKYNEISKELAKREKKCNKKVVFEYQRPKTDPYESYNNLEEFMANNPFDTDSSCKIVDDNNIRADKYNRYYKNIYTKARCNNAKGNWNKKTVNRNNTYDMGNCWVNEDDAECGELLNDDRLLRKSEHINGNISRNDIKSAKESCEVNPKCHLKRIRKHLIDCVSKDKVEEYKIKSLTKNSSENSIKSKSSSIEQEEIDFANIEKSLYDLYNSPNAPETLQLIGKGNRCVEGYIEEEEEVDELDKHMMVKIDEKEKPPLAKLEISKSVMSMNNFLKYNYNNYLRYIYFILISIDLDSQNNWNLFKIYMDDGTDDNVQNFIQEIFLYMDEYKKNYNSGEIKFVAPIYEKYFKGFFLDIDTSSQDLILSNYEYIQQLFMLTFITSLSPKIKDDTEIIRYFMGENYIYEKYNNFITYYLEIYPELIFLSDSYDKNPDERTYKLILELKKDLKQLYIDTFPDYFTSKLSSEIEGYKYIYIRYVRYLLSLTDPLDYNKSRIFKEHIATNIGESPIDAFSSFIYEYNLLFKKKEVVDIFEYFELYRTYFPEFFTYNDISIYLSFMKTKILQYDPNNKDDYSELKKYNDDNNLEEFKQLYNSIDNTNDDYENKLNKLYKKYFPKYFNYEENDSNSKKSSYKSLSSSKSSFKSLSQKSLSSSKSSSIKSYGPLMTPSSVYNTISELEISSVKVENPKNPKLPTTPQSIINNICKTIHKNNLDKRGMLIWHSTGSGKTCTATSIMDGFWGTKQKIIYCSSRDALTSNPPINFYKCAADLFPQFAGKTLDKIEKEFKNVSFFSFAQLANRIVKGIINLNNCILIIDEVHNLFRPLSNQRKQHNYLEKLLLNGSKYPKMKIFILTATLGDNPEEIFKLLNIVRNNKTPEILQKDLDNIDDFKLKIRGLVSYFDMSNDTSKFPIVIHKDPIYINMSNKQFEQYITKYKEVKDAAKDYNKLSKNNMLNKYWAAARRYSNMLYNFEKGLTLREFSAKLEELLLNVANYPNQKQYIYSAFYENKGYGGHGILAVAKQLNSKGYTKLTPTEAIKIMSNPTENDKKPRYILAISTQLGTDKGADLDKLRALFNAPYNKNGEYVQLFLASQTYNEGIDLKAVRHIHIFEPLITWASDKQTIGRAARLCSHSDLNKKDWNVTIHRYMSSFPTINMDNGGINKDELLMKIDEIERKEEEFKEKIKIYKKIITDIKKEITKNKKKPLESVMTKLTGELDLNEKNIIEIKNMMESNKSELKVLKTKLKKILKDEDLDGKSKNKKKLDTTDIDNIDDFIYKNALSKMQNILSLYQAMREAAIDCQVLKEFHSSGNQDINCHKY